MRPIVNIYRLGRVSYIKALNIQNVLFDNLKRIVTSPRDCNSTNLNDNIYRHDEVGERIRNILEFDSSFKLAGHVESQRPNLNVTNSIMLVEHEPVYTVGLRVQSYNENYITKLKTKLLDKNLEADFVQTNRGGLITFHGPGQLVAYPIIHLGDFIRTVPNKSVKSYVKKLEDTIIDTLAKVGLNGAHTVREHPGVWVGNGERKVAFVGITCKRYVTMHGISINCDCDLSWFDHINSCGIEDKLITSVKNELESMNTSIYYEPVNAENLRVSSNHGVQFIKGNLSNNDDPQSLDKDPKISSPGYNVHNIANAFCSSFAHHFDCEMQERWSPKQDLAFCSQ